MIVIIILVNRNCKKRLETINFIIAGIMANIASFLAFTIGYYLTGIGAFSSSLIGQTVGISISYLYNSRKTFKRKLGSWWKFLYFFYYTINLLIVSQSIDYLIAANFNPQLSWITCVGVAALINYLNETATL